MMWTTNPRRSGLFGELVKMQREMERMSRNLTGGVSSRVFPPINIYENADGYSLRAEMPGIDPDTLDITITKNEIGLKGERKPPELAEGERYHRRERNFGKFSRVFTLPGNVDSDNIQAMFTNGILDLTIPRKPEVQPRKIAILGK